MTLLNIFYQRKSNNSSSSNFFKNSFVTNVFHSILFLFQCNSNFYSRNFYSRSSQFTNNNYCKEYTCTTKSLFGCELKRVEGLNNKGYLKRENGVSTILAANETCSFGPQNWKTFSEDLSACSFSWLPTSFRLQESLDEQCIRIKYNTTIYSQRS